MSLLWCKSKLIGREDVFRLMSIDRPVFERLSADQDDGEAKNMMGHMRLSFLYGYWLFAYFICFSAMVDSVLHKEYGNIEQITFEGQVVYKVSLMAQLIARVKHGIIPVVPAPRPDELETVQDFLKSPCVNDLFHQHQDFQGHLCFLSVWADGGAAFQNQRGGLPKSIWVVMVRQRVWKTHKKPDSLRLA